MVLLAGYGATSVFPTRWDPWIAKKLWLGFTFTARWRIERLSRKLRAVLRPLLDEEEALRVARDCYRVQIEDRWGRFRGLHKFGWNPRIDIEGRRHVGKALAADRGVVIWIMSFCGGPIFKQAFWRMGIPLVHLSRPDHGASSDSRVGLEIVAPVLGRAETPYLAERVLISNDTDTSYFRILMRRLATNACVSVVGDGWVDKGIRTPFFAAHAAFASGAPTLAWHARCALLTAYAVRVNAFHYRFVVEEPVAVSRDLGRKEFARLAVEEYSRRLQHEIQAHPSNWKGWLADTRP